MSNQYLKLRRSNVSGRIPTTASLDFGEIALNTYDGLAFIKKSGSNGEEIVTIGSTEGAFTGSFSGSFNGQFSGSFSGSGADLSNIPASAIIGLNLSQIATASFTASVSPTQFTITSASVTEFTVTGTGVNLGNTITDRHTITGSVSITGSLSVNDSPVILTNQTASMSVLSASFASTASLSLNTVSASFASTASRVNQLNQDVVISGSLTVSGSTNLVGSTGVTLFSANADTLIFTGSIFTSGSIISTGSLNITSITSSLFGTASYALNYNDPFRITTGSIEASVSIDSSKLFLIKSGSQEFFNIKSNSETTVSSNLFIIKNFTTQQPVLVVSESIVRIVTSSIAPTGTYEAGAIWFTSNDMYISLD